RWPSARPPCRCSRRGMIMISLERGTDLHRVRWLSGLEAPHMRRESRDRRRGAPAHRLQLLDTCRRPLSFHHDRAQQRATIELFCGTPDDVADRLAMSLLSKNLFAAGQDRLVLGQLRAPLAGVFGQLVCDVERRSIARHTHPGADAEAVDG